MKTIISLDKIVCVRPIKKKLAKKYKYKRERKSWFGLVTKPAGFYYQWEFTSEELETVEQIEKQGFIIEGKRFIKNRGLQ